MSPKLIKFSSVQIRTLKNLYEKYPAGIFPAIKSPWSPGTSFRALRRKSLIVKLYEDNHATYWRLSDEAKVAYDTQTKVYINDTFSNRYSANG